MSSELSLLTEILESDNWPKAVPDNQICDLTSEEDKRHRAKGIVDIILDRSLDGKRFLDVGCGEGHVCEHLANYSSPKVCVGYDIERPDATLWASDSLNLVDDWVMVKDRAPYDVILLYDVLDHTYEGEVVPLLKRVKDVCAKDAVIFVRTHPWCGRHGGHLYHKTNKAFLHLIFTEVELIDMGFSVPQMQKVLHPQKRYGEWFNKAGFGSPKHHVVHEKPEEIFRESQVLRDRLRSHWSDSFDSRARIFPEFQMAQSYVDYIITVKKESIIPP